MSNFKKFEGEQVWMEEAECLGSDPDLMFPTRGDFIGMQAAKAVCAECVVKDECLDYALKNNEKFGIWGGESERARRKMKQGMKRATLTLVPKN